MNLAQKPGKLNSTMSIHALYVALSRVKDPNQMFHFDVGTSELPFEQRFATVLKLKPSRAVFNFIQLMRSKRNDGTPIIRPDRFDSAYIGVSVPEKKRPTQTTQQRKKAHRNETVELAAATCTQDLADAPNWLGHPNALHDCTRVAVSSCLGTDGDSFIADSAMDFWMRRLLHAARGSPFTATRACLFSSTESFCPHRKHIQPVFVMHAAACGPQRSRTQFEHHGHWVLFVFFYREEYGDAAVSVYDSLGGGQFDAAIRTQVTDLREKLQRNWGVDAVQVDFRRDTQQPEVECGICVLNSARRIVQPLFLPGEELPEIGRHELAMAVLEGMTAQNFEDPVASECGACPP